MENVWGEAEGDARTGDSVRVHSVSSLGSITFQMDKRTSKRLRDTVLCPPKTHRTFVFVAALVRRGKVLAMATNRVSASARAVSCATTVAFDGTCTVHAERAVVRRAGIKQLRDASLVVWRDNCKASAPCKACEAFLCKCILDWGLRGVFYTPSV